MHVWYHQPTISVWRRLFLVLGIPALIVAFITTGLLAISAKAASGINQTMSFQGRLLNSSGGVVPDGYYNMQFKIYQDGDGTKAGDTGGTGGTLKWTETYVNNSANAGVQVSDGFFSVTLGSKTPFGGSVDWNSDTLWLSMNVAGSASDCSTFGSGTCSADGEMLPMKRITSAPYAMNAGLLNGKSDTDFAAATGSTGYIQNQTVSAQAAGFNISGTGTIQGDSTAAFNVQNTTGTSLLSVDTTNNLVLAAGLQIQTSTGTDVGSWSTSPNSLPVTLTNSSYVSANGYAYVIGGKDATGTGTGQAVSTVYYAKMNSDGSLGSWTTASNPLPSTRKNATSVTANGYVYVIGGVDTNNTMEATVYYAKLNADGSVGTWSTASNALPASIGYSASLVANGYVYVMGGSGFDGSSPVNSVYYAKLNADGTVGSWTTSSNPLPYSPYSPVAVTHGGYAYVMTGWNGSDYDDAYYAKLNSDGTTGSWTATTNLPAPLERAQGLVSNDNLYVFGGYSNGANVATVYKVNFNSDGSLGTWETESNALPVATRGVSLGTANNYVYVIGGDVDSGVSSAVYSASLISDSGDGSSTTLSTDSQLLTMNGAMGVNIQTGSVVNVKTSTTNIQIGDGDGSGNPMLLTLDNSSSAPSSGSAPAGSMYYDTSLNAIQCYNGSTWGSCDTLPDTFVSLSPEYAGAVLQGSGDGTLVSGMCSSDLHINDGTSSQPSICGSNETYNYYNWTSTDATSQDYSIFVSYQLPSTFSKFVAGSTSILGKTDSSDSSISYQLYRKASGGALTACGSSTAVSSGAQTTWQKASASGTADPSSCSFAAGDTLYIKISVSAANSAHAYTGPINFAFSNTN